MFKVTSRWPHQDSVKIEWNLGKRCNYDCTYCPKEIHDNSSPHTDISILKAAVDKLITLKKPLRISFTGGEPSVHPKFDELLHHCTPSVSWVSVTTNGTRTPEWYSKQPISSYVFSLHFEYDYKRVVDTILRVFELGWKRDRMMVNIMAHHKYMKEVKDAVNSLKYYAIPYVIRRVRWTDGDHDIFDDLRYDQLDLDWILEHQATVQPNTLIDEDMYHANDVIKLHLNQFKGWSCNAGIESLMINWDGEVHRATCRVGGSLGNIYTGTFEVPTEPIICDRNFCTCAADIPLTKHANTKSNHTEV
jgi:MoaA/NifB/PqqE/SkfB family radical SAM enzyme